MPHVAHVRHCEVLNRNGTRNCFLRMRLVNLQEVSSSIFSFTTQCQGEAFTNAVRSDDEIYISRPISQPQILPFGKIQKDAS